MEHAQELGPYLLLRPLGKGGMGVVYLVKTKDPDEPLAALKRLRPDIAKMPGFAERFWHEGEIARRLKHPALVGTIDVGEAEGRQYVVSEFVLGKSAQMIADRLSDRNLGASVAVVTRILIDTASALAYVHDARDDKGRPLYLVHRDVTPGNLLIGYDGAVKLADFGLAKSLLSENLMLTAEGAILGTPRYLPLEIVRGERATRKSDIYGLGAVAYRLLTGSAPYEGEVKDVIAAILRGPPKPLRELRPDVPPWLGNLVEQMMARDAADRPPDAGVIERELSRVAEMERQLLRRDQLGSWLVELFRNEAAVERAEVEELEVARTEKLRPDDPAETRVITPNKDVDAPTLIDGRSGHERAGFGMEMPTVKQAMPKIATTFPEVVSLPAAKEAITREERPSSNTDEDDGALAVTHAPRTETEVVRRGPMSWLLMALLAGAIGLMAGMFWPADDAFDQLGDAKKRIALHHLSSPKIDQLVAEASRAIIEGQEKQAQLTIQDLNVAIDTALTSTRAR
jgi:serine/threonine protein kinase